MNEIEFPYLDRKISSDSLEYAKENMLYSNSLFVGISK